MHREAGEKQAAIALQLIDDAFAGRSLPSVWTDSTQLTDGEYAEVMSFRGVQWKDVTFTQVAQCPDAVFWFSPEAFCYYLPGILAAGLREGRWDTNAYDSILGWLDRSPEPGYWDDFFLQRWPLLSVRETESVAAWARWLEIVQPEESLGNIYERVQDTLTRLAASN